MVLTAEQFRERRALQKYARNAAGKIVRRSAFRQCDYIADGRLREFDTEADVLNFEAERYKDGTGHKVKFWKKPKATVPREQLALQEEVVHAVQEDGNQTRVQLEGVEEGLHGRLDEMEYRLGKLLEYHEEAPPSKPGDLQLMARCLKQIKVRRMNEVLAKFGDRPAGLKKEDKAALLIERVPREDLLRLLESPDALVEPPMAKRAKTTAAPQPTATPPKTLLEMFKLPKGKEETDTSSTSAGASGAESPASSSSGAPASTN